VDIVAAQTLCIVIVLVIKQQEFGVDIVAAQTLCNVIVLVSNNIHSVSCLLSSAGRRNSLSADVDICLLCTQTGDQLIPISSLPVSQGITYYV
jgi:hypothetical protein